MSIISRQEVLPNYERVWEQNIIEEAYLHAIGELLEQGEAAALIRAKTEKVLVTTSLQSTGLSLRTLQIERNVQLEKLAILNLHA